MWFLNNRWTQLPRAQTPCYLPAYLFPSEIPKEEKFNSLAAHEEETRAQDEEATTSLTQSSSTSPLPLHIPTFSKITPHIYCAPPQGSPLMSLWLSWSPIISVISGNSGNSLLITPVRPTAGIKERMWHKNAGLNKYKIRGIPIKKLESPLRIRRPVKKGYNKHDGLIYTAS